MTSPSLVELSPAELALRLRALRGTSVYVAYVAPADTVADVLAELDEELRAVDEQIEIAGLAVPIAASMIIDAAASSAEVLLVDARFLAADDWALLDRRRSALAHEGVLVFMTTPASFGELMRVAPNLASWLGAHVYAYRDEREDIAETRSRRLASLRSWAGKSDEEVVAAAEAGALPGDPEYAEWLVLLGRADLIRARDA